MDSVVGTDLDMSSTSTKAIVGKKLLAGYNDPLPGVDGTVTMTVKLVAQTGSLELATAAFKNAMMNVP